MFFRFDCALCGTARVARRVSPFFNEEIDSAVNFARVERVRVLRDPLLNCQHVFGVQCSMSPGWRVSLLARVFRFGDVAWDSDQGGATDSVNLTE